MRTLILKRVMYGKPGVPLKEREYKLEERCPAGTIDEFSEIHRSSEASYLKLIDIDGTYLCNVNTGEIKKI